MLPGAGASELKMNDPHVEALIYRVEHGPGVDYDKAEALEYETPSFNIRVDSGKARFELKDHYDTEEAAREAVEPFIRAWEVAVGLDQGPDKFALVFDTSEVVDRNPPPGVNIHATVGRMVITAFDADVHLSHHNYPEPPEGLAVNHNVISMNNRYLGYRRGKEPLAAMAHFCLTVLQASIGTTRKRRRITAERYKISQPVLSKLGELTTNKGGLEARKAGGADEEFTVQERQWIEATIKAIIRRAAEVAHGPGHKLQQITFAGLPPLKPPA